MYFFDTYAIFEILKENPNYQRFSEEVITTSTLNVGEFYYKIMRETSKHEAERITNMLNLQLMNVIRKETILSAMVFRQQHRKKKLSMVDCIGYILAQEKGLLFLTGDKEFKDLPNVEFVK